MCNANVSEPKQYNRVNGCEWVAFQSVYKCVNGRARANFRGEPAQTTLTCKLTETDRAQLVVASARARSSHVGLGRAYRRRRRRQHCVHMGLSVRAEPALCDNRVRTHRQHAQRDARIVVTDNMNQANGCALCARINAYTHVHTCARDGGISAKPTG